MSQMLSDSIAEFNILSLALQDEKDLNEIAHEIHLEDFVEERHQLIFQAILVLYKEDQKVNYQTISDKLGNNLLRVGSLNYLLDLKNSSAGYDLEYLIKILKQKSKLREIVAFGSSLAKGLQISKDFDDFLSSSTSKANDVFNFIDEKTVINLKEFLVSQPIYNEAVDRQKKKAEGIEIFRGYPTGYQDLDKKILGLRQGHLVIIGARPGIGKTTFMLNLVDKMKALKVAIFSLEMTSEELVTKLVLLKAKVNYDMFSGGMLNPSDIQSIHGFSKELSARSIMVDESSGIRPYEILGKARRWKAAYGLDIIFIDYLQLMNGNDRKYESNQVKVASISRDLKRISKILEMPVVALAQVNRSPESRTSTIPKISDLRESGAIEADADHIWLLNRTEKLPSTLEVHIGKNRFGAQGKVELYWDLEKGNIESKLYNY